ncbi:MAG: heme biosynthesis protein HemY [Xanthobacteraceae bacterium]|nr:MAG: heme biosynthesis protein HemY [Xanthobacteraceae bacterium]
MFRTIVFLIAIGLAAAGVAWVAEQAGGVTLVWSGWRVETSLPVFVFMIAAAAAAMMLAWSVLRALWRLPRRLRAARVSRRALRGRKALTQGLLAIGTGDARAARRHAHNARRLVRHDPLTLLLDAQAAQLSGDANAARAAFHAMALREDTRLLGLRGLFIEAQRHDDAVSAAAIAEQALKVAPGMGWAALAVLGFRCARGDWSGALAILEANHAARAIDKAAYQRQRAVLMTAQALELETTDRDRARELAMTAVKLAPTLVPAATLASRFFSESHQIRKAMRVLETAWHVNPHPDLAEAYAHVRLGDSARERLARVEALAARTDGHAEGALALSRAAIDAGEFARARAALAGLTAAPTQRVAMLMAEIERGEGQDGRAREWTLRAVRAAPDPAWTADGYVSSRWHPVSPVSGEIDAFRWVVPVAALPADGGAVIAAEPEAASPALPPAVAAAPAAEPSSTEPAPAAPEPPAPAAVPPMFRPRRDLPAGALAGAAPAAPVIPLVRAPDDPGVRDEAVEEAEGRPGGWRGVVERWVG